MAAGRLAVGAGDPDHQQSRGRVAVERRADVAQLRRQALDLQHRNSAVRRLAARAVRHDRRRSARHGVGHVEAAVVAPARQREEHVAGPDLAAVDPQVRRLGRVRTDPGNGLPSLPECVSVSHRIRRSSQTGRCIARGQRERLRLRGDLQRAQGSGCHLGENGGGGRRYRERRFDIHLLPWQRCQRHRLGRRTQERRHLHSGSVPRQRRP